MSIYDSLYQLVAEHIFGSVASAPQELVCTLVSTFGAIFLIALPFALVWRFIIAIMGE